MFPLRVSLEAGRLMIGRKLIPPLRVVIPIEVYYKLISLSFNEYVARSRKRWYCVLG